MFTNWLTKSQNRLTWLSWEISYEQDACKEDPARSRKYLNELKKEERKLKAELDAFHSDPMTQYVGL